MIKTLSFHCQEVQVRSLVRELRSHMPHGTADKANKKTESLCCHLKLTQHCKSTIVQLKIFLIKHKNKDMLTLLIIKCPLELTAIQQLFCYFVVGVNLMYLFWCAGSSLLCRLLSSCAEQGQLSTRAGASLCSGFSCGGTGALGYSDSSSCGSQVLRHRLSTCGAQA